MISKEAIRRGFNRGAYVVGAPTPPHYAATFEPRPGPAGFQHDVMSVPPEVEERLRSVADDVVVDPIEVIRSTRDWWVGTMISETGGEPAASTAVVVKVSSTEQVQSVMRIADAAAIAVTVSAGRSNVTGAALPVRGGIVLDVCGLDRFVSFDPVSQIVEVEAGVFGDIFEQTIQAEYGMTLGHWPSSFALSTVGGWVACRGAGQLSTRYGKIEDMVHSLDFVRADGELVTVGHGTRAATGPDLRQLLIGSEGTLGVITTVRLKLHRLPTYGRAVAYGFPTFRDGLEACREIMQSGATPAVLRLYDQLESGIQFDLPETNVLLIADEGTPELVDATIGISERVCATSGEELDGGAVFERWLDTRYLTGKSSEGFTRGPGFVSDTLEMSGRWSDLPAIHEELLSAINAVPGTLAGSVHESHAYVDGACLYFSLRGDVEVEQRAHWYRSVMDAANAVLLRHDAIISHHHGVGLVRAPYLPESLGPSFEILAAVKRTLDPKNLLNPGKLGLPS
ncbi:MAG: FAD-binding oxidoreductase [Microbacterium sp.]